jgi:LmbE family N-acetylglucosaminyl deacetylase
MIQAGFKYDSEKGINIFAVGAHCDDIEIGCGATLLKLFEEYKIGHIKWVVFASTPQRKKEAIASAEQFLSDVKHKEIVVLDYRDAFLEQSKFEIKEHFELFKKDFNPDLVFTHYRNDRHQDHRLLSDLVWNTFRNHLVLEYEIPKYDGDLGVPNMFVEIRSELADRKAQILLDCFESQLGKHWFDKETFLALMRIRGMEAASKEKYAEAFHLRKLVF